MSISKERGTAVSAVTAGTGGGPACAGSARDAGIMALAGWFLIHGHACFLFFVPVIIVLRFDFFVPVIIVLRFDQKSWPDVAGFVVQAGRTGVRAGVLNPVWRFMMTSQFICTSPEIADSRLYWFRTVAPRGSTVIARLRQAVVTAGP